MVTSLAQIEEGQPYPCIVIGNALNCPTFHGEEGEKPVRSKDRNWKGKPVATSVSEWALSLEQEREGEKVCVWH